MKIQLVTPDNQSDLLALMHESYNLDAVPTDEWEKAKSAITQLLRDPQAGEAYFILNPEDKPIGYMIMCRGFSLDYGGYFTWVEETYLQQTEQGRFRDSRFTT